MIGKTNLPLGGDKGENVNISLTTNQTDSSDIIGAVITVTYAGESTQYSWNGQTITVNIPSNKAYFVEFSGVNGYATPTTFSATSVKGNSRTVTAEYKTCVVTLNITDNQSSYNDIASAKATITGSASGTLSNGGTIKVPWGGTITATGSAVSGYSTPSGTATANAVSKTLTLTYATEILTLKMATDGATPTGYTLTVKNSAGTTLATQTTATGTHKIPYGTSYYVTASEVTNFTTPSNSPTYTASNSSNASRTITMTYQVPVETLTVTVSGILSGFTVNIYRAMIPHDIIGSQTTTGKTYSIPAGTPYQIVASSVDGYVCSGNSPIYTAKGGNARSFTISYVVHAGTKNPSNGVYIQDTDGYFHTSDEWDGTFTANSVAVITANCRFGIALENAYSGDCEWGGYGTFVEGIGSSTSESVAEADYAGESNTTIIINALAGTNGGAPAAEYCRAYIFPNGAVGYLGAAGEWKLVFYNKSEINAALIKCGATLSDYYWTSTQYNLNRSWYMQLGSGVLNRTAKNDGTGVRAFSAI